jgi:hypothetical protein
MEKMKRGEEEMRKKYDQKNKKEEEEEEKRRNLPIIHLIMKRIVFEFSKYITSRSSDFSSFFLWVFFFPIPFPPFHLWFSPSPFHCSFFFQSMYVPFPSFPERSFILFLYSSVPFPFSVLRFVWNISPFPLFLFYIPSFPNLFCFTSVLFSPFFNCSISLLPLVHFPCPFFLCSISPVPSLSLYSLSTRVFRSVGTYLPLYHVSGDSFLFAVKFI